MGNVVPFLRLSTEVRALLDGLAARRGVTPESLVEELVRGAAAGEGLEAGSSGEPFLVLESTEEVPAIGPEGRGRKVHLKGIDETGEWDAGEIFLPDPPKR
jgi:hypothetical protein